MAFENEARVGGNLSGVRAACSGECRRGDLRNLVLGLPGGSSRLRATRDPWLPDVQEVHKLPVVHVDVLDHDCCIWDQSGSSLVVRSIRSRFVGNTGCFPGLTSSGHDPVMNKIPNLVSGCSADSPVPQGTGIPQWHRSGRIASFEFSDSLFDDRSVT